MHWLVLVLSGVLEAVWATALGRSDGFSRLGPSVVFGVAALASFAGLAYAMKGLPIGTAYAVWVGIGVAGAAIFGAVFHAEPMTLGRVMSLLLVLLGIVGLRLTSPPS